MKARGVGESCTLQQGLPGAVVEVLVPDGRASGIGNPLACALLCCAEAVLPKGGSSAYRAALRRADNAVVHAPVHAQCPGVEVYVPPLQSAQFSLPHARGYCQDVQYFPPVAPGGVQERPHLLMLERYYLPLDRARWDGGIRHDPAQQLQPDRVFQSFADGPCMYRTLRADRPASSFWW
jgi:hypothetical protein